jgi:hypothetical protein
LAANLVSPLAYAQDKGDGSAATTSAGQPALLALPPAPPAPAKTVPAQTASAPNQAPSGDAPLPADAPHTITDWREGEPIPLGYHPVQRMRSKAVIGGAVLLGSLYLTSLLAATIATDNANQNNQSNGSAGLYVPVFGPFIAMTQTSTATGTFVLVVDGLGQATGAVLLIWGLASPQALLVRNDYARARVLPRPMVFGTTGGGVGWAGTF